MALPVGLPPIAQLGYVVRSLDASLALYEPLFGPFRRMEASVPGADYRGRVADCELRLAFAWSGKLEIELIEWVSGESPHREFLESGREGMHHLQFRVDDCDGWTARLAPLGYAPIWTKRWSPDTAFTYLERRGDPTILELLQMPGPPGSGA